MVAFREAEIWQALNEVKDPELPLISVVELGIVRDVLQDAEGGVVVKMTPTFSGCPALAVMQRDIETAVKNLGFEQVTVKTVLHPPWTSDWIKDTAREKLKTLNISPPLRHGGDMTTVAFLDVAECPRCGSKNSVLKNAFGPTLCKSVWYCQECQDAFEQFKPL